jgi:putative ABC transport system permease protein
MFRELRLAVRRFAGQRTFALTAVATLAVGIGATTAIFSTVNATLLRPLPYPRAQDIYKVNTRFVDGRWTSGRMTTGYIAGIAESAPSVVAAVGVFNGDAVVLADDGRNVQVLQHGVSEGFFDLLGVPMAAGRAFRPEEHAGGPAAPGVVISDRLWARLFGRDPAAIGRSLRMATGEAPIVGVTPPEFDVPEGTDLWVPFSLGPNGVSHTLQSYLRVEPGTTEERLAEELATVMVTLTERFPGAATGRAFVVQSLNESIIGDLGTILLVVLWGAVLLMVLGCANVATLVLARGLTRTRELAVRCAHGAVRSVIVKQFLTEAFVLSAAGTALGLLLAFFGVRALLAFGAADLPRLEQVPFDFRVLAFTAAVLAFTTLVVALIPAGRLATPDIRGLLQDSGRSSTGTGGTRVALSGLVVAEIALGIALVSGAGWLARSYANLAETDPGFTPDGRLVFEALLTGSLYAPPPQIIEGPDGRLMLDPEWVPTGTPRSWLEGLEERLLGTGQVTAVGAATTRPFGIDWDVGYYIASPGEDYDPERQETVQRRGVSPDYFGAMGTPVVMGRALGIGDGFDAAVVSEEFVRRYLRGRNPLESTFAWGFPSVDFDNVVRIVGVVADVKYTDLAAEPEPNFYQLAYPQRANVAVATTLADPMAFVPTLRSAVAELDPSIPIDIRPLQDVHAAQLVRQRLGLMLMITFALVSLGLAAIGIYGVVSHATTQRSKELAMRLALGATPGGLVKLVITQGRGVALVGAVAGLAASYVGGRVVAARLVGVRAVDPLVLSVASVAVLGVALLGYLIPAARAARTQPAVSLRLE